VKNVILKIMENQKENLKKLFEKIVLSTKSLKPPCDTQLIKKIDDVPIEYKYFMDTYPTHSELFSVYCHNSCNLIYPVAICKTINCIATEIMEDYYIFYGELGYVLSQEDFENLKKVFVDKKTEIEYKSIEQALEEEESDLPF
jgi:hypothetical protein